MKTLTDTAVTSVRLSVRDTLIVFITRKLCYSKDDRAMRAI